MAVRLQAEPFAPGALLDAFCRGRSEVGAVVSFTGLVRADGGAAETLELETYLGFAEQEIGRAVDEAVERYALQDALVVHRHGVLRPGEAIVFVAAAAPHRRAAFQAADQLMDYLKSRAPFWKRAAGAGGAAWIEPTAQDRADARRWDALEEAP